MHGSLNATWSTSGPTLEKYVPILDQFLVFVGSDLEQVSGFAAQVAKYWAASQTCPSLKYLQTMQKPEQICMFELFSDRFPT